MHSGLGRGIKVLTYLRKAIKHHPGTYLGGTHSDGVKPKPGAEGRGPQVSSDGYCIGKPVPNRQSQQPLVQNVTG